MSINAFEIVVAVVVIAIIVCGVVVFLKMPKETQIKKIKEWLVYACAEAEKSLGSGTGQLKLRMVYDMFIGKFPSIASWITFDTFSAWVDVALDEMNTLINSNKDISNAITNNSTTE